MKMHDGEVDIDAELVRRLLHEQFPQLADLPISAVQSTGTVNALYRIGDDLCARLPRLAAWADGIERERRWLPLLAPQLSLEVPAPVLEGEPSSGYPFGWAVYGWIEGRPYADDLVSDERQAADELAQFVLELRRVDLVAGAPRGGREPLHELDAVTRAALGSAQGVIDSDAAIAAWDHGLQAPAWEGTPVWVHADLLRPNVLVHDGRLRAVIDFGGVGVGDPATDVIAAWSMFGRSGRATYRDVLDVDDDMWNRARGYALTQAAMIIPYYAETNPGFVALAKRTVEQVVADLQS